MDSLPQYGSYAFIPYLTPSNYESSCSASTTTSPPTNSPETLKVTNTSSWTYSGPILAPSSSSLPPSFHTWSTQTFTSPPLLLTRLLPLLSFLTKFLSRAGITHYWLTIRASPPHATHTIPRWHVDDDFFSTTFTAKAMQDSNTSTTRRWKLATTILGPGTLFLEKNHAALNVLRRTKRALRSRHAHECTELRCLGCSTYADDVRAALARQLGVYTVTSPAVNEVSFFRLGEHDGAVHSEPRCDGDRVFVNVVPGTEGELRKLMGKWGVGFPRAWCLGGLGVQSDEAGSFF